MKRLWIEKASDIAEEYYASFTLDRAAKKHLGMLSARGWRRDRDGRRVENPDAIAKIWIDPVVGLTDDQVKDWVAAAKLNPAANAGTVELLCKLYAAFTEGDADLVEINPLILTPEGKVHALDAKVTLDDNAAFRHDWDEYDATQERDEREQAAHDKGLQYVGLDGTVGVIANGAGLAMSTVDIVNQVGGHPGQLPRHRRRRQRRGDGRRARGHQQRPEGAGDLHQHLRRHHQGRGGRQRHRRPRSGGSRSTARS